MKNIVKKAPQEPKAETPEVLSYTKELKEIKELLKIIADRLIDLKLTGGF